MLAYTLYSVRVRVYTGICVCAVFYMSFNVLNRVLVSTMDVSHVIYTAFCLARCMKRFIINHCGLYRLWGCCRLYPGQMTA
ncbi:hypothetical protein GDO81_009296 [Engystomops pustulosus]|uniref:Uncharacterized protein n=1 Tax=Engystomops pustulosus TaxID=76066 RepID=A0AAV7BQQ0_ENGPU|nr:hypothetical protein GDO81_009296 [Engystomops pustulosus]